MIAIDAEKALRVDWDELPVRDSVAPSHLRSGRFGSEERRPSDPRLDYADPDEVSRLRDALSQRGISQAAFARLAGYSDSYISLVFRLQKLPSRRQLARLWAVLEGAE